jgi:two-component system, OmpR family, phosphate regulon response regulator PhoB
MRTVLIVEDDDLARALANETLSRDGYRVLEAANVADAKDLLARESVELIVLDLGLPDQSGLELLTDLRRTDDTAVIIVTGRGELEDRVVGLRLGADDYLVKPIAPSELNARVEAVLRRRGPAARTQTLTHGALTIDREAREVRVDGELVELTPIEFDLLAFLAAHPRRVFSRGELLERVWNSSADWQVASTVTEHVRKVRQKLAESGIGDQIATVRGVGYRFDP